MSVFVERELCTQNLDEGPAIEKELTWGKSFRVTRVENQTSPVKPKHSPMCVPFDLSAASHRHHRKKKKCCQCAEKSRRTTKSMVQVSLLERSVLSQDKYTELLSVPNKTYIQKVQSTKSLNKIKPKTCHRCYEPCSPRITQMAVPNKRLVLENWKAYQHTLPTEILMRFDEILKSGGNLEPREARHYFKQVTRRRLKEVRKRKCLLKKKKAAKQRGDMAWLREEICKTVFEIVNFIEREPLIMLNYQQMMTSNELLAYLCTHKIVKVKGRNCKCPYQRTVIEISDKFIKWMDSISFFAEIQPLDSREELKLPPFEQWLEEESEEEEEEEEKLGEPGGELAEWGREHGEMDEDEMEGYETGGTGYPHGTGKNLEEFIAEKIVDRSQGFGQHGDGSLFNILHDFDNDTLEKLIHILSMSPDGFLEEDLDPSAFPGVTHGDVLRKLKEMRDNNFQEKQKGHLFLEERMIEWAKTNDPDNVDERVLNKIHETSTILSELFKHVDPSDLSAYRTADDGAYDDQAMVVEEIFGKSERQGLQAAPPIIEVDEDLSLETFRTDVGRGPTWEDPSEYGEDNDIEDEDWLEQERRRREAGPEGQAEDREGAEGGELDGEDAEGRELDGEDAEGRKRREGAMWEEEEEEEEEGMWEGEEEGIGEGEEGMEEGEEGMRQEAEVREGEEGKEVKEGKEGNEGEEPGVTEDADKMMEKVGSELEKLDTLMGIIRGHKPSVVYEHEPGTICCLSLKTWAAWLLEIANHAHNWTRWITDIIKHVRYYLAVIRGDVPEKKCLPKAEWREFVKDTQEKVELWRAYSQHVRDLSEDIIKNFRGKPVTCCPKCLQDHLIKNVVSAHETLQALTEAINCAEYWHTCLDKMVGTTSKLAGLEMADEVELDEESLESEGSYTIEIEELPVQRVCAVASEDSWEIQIEELQVERRVCSEYDFIEMLPIRVNLPMQEIEELHLPAPPMKELPDELGNKKPKKEDKKPKKPLKSNMKKR